MKEINSALTNIINDDNLFNEFCKLIFNDFDNNKTGYISYESFNNILNTISLKENISISDKKIKETFNLLSDHTSNKLTYKEFSDFIKYILKDMKEKNE